MVVICSLTLSQVDAQLLVVQKLEEKEGVLQSTLATLEKELALRTQALELNKRKVKPDHRRPPLFSCP